MICYLDKTFCKYLECKNVKCNRRLTEETEKNAREIDLPVSLYSEKPLCFKK